GLFGPKGLQPEQAFRPVFLGGLATSAERQSPRWDVLGDHRAGTYVSALPDLDRRHQRRVRTNESAAADFGAVLGGAVVIAGNSAGADIGIGADRGVAQIGQMIGLGARFHHRFLDLDEITDPRAFAKLCARAKPRKRSNRHALADMRAGNVRERMNDSAIVNRDL